MPKHHDSIMQINRERYISHRIVLFMIKKISIKFKGKFYHKKYKIDVLLIRSVLKRWSCCVRSINSGQNWIMNECNKEKVSITLTIENMIECYIR